MSAAMTSRKIVIATCTPCTVVSRSVLMSVIITFMFEPAKLQMNCASASGTSTLRSAGWRPATAVGHVGSRQVRRRSLGRRRGRAGSRG